MATCQNQSGDWVLWFWFLLVHKSNGTLVSKSSQWDQGPISNPGSASALHSAGAMSASFYSVIFCRARRRGVGDWSRTREAGGFLIALRSQIFESENSAAEWEVRVIGSQFEAPSRSVSALPTLLSIHPTAPAGTARHHDVSCGTARQTRSRRIDRLRRKAARVRTVNLLIRHRSGSCRPQLTVEQFGTPVLVRGAKREGGNPRHSLLLPSYVRNRSVGTMAGVISI